MIRGNTFGIFVFFTAFALSACDSAQTTTVKSKLTVPTDEATGEQRSQLDEMLTRIESLTSELGQPRRFRDVPVVVSSDDRTYTDHPAACVSSGGDPQFILVKPSVFANEQELREAGEESSLFRVLLHEIGHCYFKRQHEEARLFEEGKTIELSVDRGGFVQAVEYPMLDATVMVPEELTAPIALERYYVAEILGLARAQTPADLAAYAPVKLVRAADLAQHP